jgi:copper chaperone CopZ
MKTLTCPLKTPYFSHTAEDAMTTLRIPDMTCGHCRASVEAALNALPGVATVGVDLAAHTVEITGTANDADMIAARDPIGFPAAVVGKSDHNPETS